MTKALILINSYFVNFIYSRCLPFMDFAFHEELKKTNVNREIRVFLKGVRLSSNWGMEIGRGRKQTRSNLRDENIKRKRTETDPKTF